MLFHRSGRFEMNVENVVGCMSHPTLFIHGNLASNRWWHPSFEIWKTRSRGNHKPGTAWLAEWRGCGKSSRNLHEADFNMDGLAEQYIEFAEDISNNSQEPMDIVGHSTGGLIALVALLRAPYRFRRAVLLDPVAPKGFQINEGLLDALKAMRQDRSQCEVVMASTIHNVSRENSLFQSIVDDAFNVDPNVWTGVPKALQETKYMEQLSLVQHPVLVMHGELDPILPKEDSKELARRLPRGSYEELAGHGHSLNVEDPMRFVDTVDRFFSEP